MSGCECKRARSVSAKHKEIGRSHKEKTQRHEEQTRLPLCPLCLCLFVVKRAIVILRSHETSNPCVPRSSRFPSPIHLRASARCRRVPHDTSVIGSRGRRALERLGRKR